MLAVVTKMVAATKTEVLLKVARHDMTWLVRWRWCSRTHRRVLITTLSQGMLPEGWAGQRGLSQGVNVMEPRRQCHGAFGVALRFWRVNNILLFVHMKVQQLVFITLTAKRLGAITWTVQLEMWQQFSYPFPVNEALPFSFTVCIRALIPDHNLKKGTFVQKKISESQSLPKQ